MEHINGFKAAVAAVLGGLTALWGWFGWLVLAWLLCMALDYGTGTAAALRAGEWSSKVARDGLWHKLGAVVAVLVAAILDGVIDFFGVIQLRASSTWAQIITYFL
jgi:phage-related holin